MPKEFCVYVSAGARQMSPTDARPEYVGKKDDWFSHPVVKECKKLGIKPGLQIVGFERFPEEFDPYELGCRYAIHAPNDLLTQLYQAHLQKDNIEYDKLWSQLENMSKLKPPPSHITFHLGGTSIVPKVLDESRFDVIADPAAVWQHLSWLRQVFKEIINLLPMAVVENNSIVQFVGPPRYNFGGEWVPMTYNEYRRGVWLDIGLIIEGIPGALVLDFEHGKFTADFLSRRGVEYASLPATKVSSLSETEYDIFSATGIVYRKGCPPHIPFPFNISNMITRYSPRVVHAGGLHPAIVELHDSPSNSYYQHLRAELPEEMWQVVNSRRIGSHAPIDLEDVELYESLRLSMLQGTDTAVVEVSPKGEATPKGSGSEGCWYWSTDDAQLTSFLNCYEMVRRARDEIGLFS